MPASQCTFEDLLHVPLERLLKCAADVEELLRLTPRQHVDYEALVQLLCKTKGMALYPGLWGWLWLTMTLVVSAI